MNLSRASNSIVRALKRRLASTTPAAQLVEDSVKRSAIPGHNREITVFIYEIAGKRVFVAEICEPELPHVYSAFRLPLDNNERATAKVMLTAIASVVLRVVSDPRFKRNIIVLNGASGRH